MTEEFEFVPGEADPALDLDVPPAQYKPLRRRIQVRGTGFLKAYRHVLANEDSYHDRDEYEKLARKLYVEDYVKFMSKFEAAEALELNRSLEKKAEKSAPDLGHDAACKVLDRLLKEAAK